MSHDHLEVPRFPRGFLLSERPVNPPPTFVPGPILPNFYVHPWATVETAGDQDLFVIILGHCVPTGPSQGADPAVDLLDALRQGEGRFLDVLGGYGGRHAVIFGKPGNLGVVNDAIGMRSVYYAAGGGVVASHAPLVERALGGTIDVSAMPYRYGYPGNRTPYARTKILTPNTYYWITANVVRRFWPITTPQPVTVDEAARILLDASSYALQSVARERTVRLTLTAGLDSRTILAIALHSGVEFGTYTYGNTRATQLDQQLGTTLAAQFGLQHTLVNTPIKDPVLKHQLVEAHRTPHHGRWVSALRHYFQDVTALSVIGNSLEIGRSNYAPQRKAGASDPIDAVTMAQLHYGLVGKDVSAEIEEYGIDRFRDVSVAAFQKFIEETGYAHTMGLLDPFDQFYWEHRMGTWQGPAAGERDFYGNPFIPFNSRNVFEALLGAPFESRRRDAAVYRMIEIVDPGLLELPVNPRHWPPRKKSKRPAPADV